MNVEIEFTVLYVKFDVFTVMYPPTPSGIDDVDILLLIVLNK